MPWEFMDLQEFVDDGYLLEVNRVLLHPLGLALVLDRDDDGTLSIAGIGDARDDPEGVTFTWDPGDVEKVRNVEQLWDARVQARVRAIGTMVQDPPTA